MASPRQNLWPFSSRKKAAKGKTAKRSTMTVGESMQAAYTAGQSSGDTGLFKPWLESKGLAGHGAALRSRLHKEYERGVISLSTARSGQTTRRTADDLNREFLKRSKAKSATFKGRKIEELPDGSWVIPSIDRDSHFDSLEDAKRFAASWSRNPKRNCSEIPVFPVGPEQFSDVPSQADFPSLPEAIAYAEAMKLEHPRVGVLGRIDGATNKPVYGVLFDFGKLHQSNPAKFDRCVKAVKARGGDVNAYAVCTAAGTRSNPTTGDLKSLPVKGLRLYRDLETQSLGRGAATAVLVPEDSYGFKWKLVHSDGGQNYFQTNDEALHYVQHHFWGYEAEKRNPPTPGERFDDLQKQGFMKRRKPAMVDFYEAWTPHGVTYKGENKQFAEQQVRLYGGKVKKVRERRSNRTAAGTRNPRKRFWVVTENGDLLNTYATKAEAQRYADSVAYASKIRVQVKDSRKRNPESSAADLYESFHGTPSTQTLEVEEEEADHEHLSLLGRLVDIWAVSLTGYLVHFEFDEEEPVWCSSAEDGRQLYFVGGDQSVDLAAFKMDGKEWRKDRMVIGQFAAPTCGKCGTEFTKRGDTFTCPKCGHKCTYEKHGEKDVVYNLGYHTKKKFDDFAPIDYQHDLGEETGVRPMLEFDPRSKHLYVTGGQYRIEQPLLDMSPGIEN